MRAFVFQTLAMLVLGVAGGVLGFWAYMHLALGIGLHDQAGSLRFPPQLAVQAKTTRDITIGLKGRIDAKVPVKQALEVPLHGQYRANLRLRARMPLRFSIDYRAEVLIHATAMVEGTTDLVMHSKLLPKFPIKAPVALNFMLPVHLVVPVDTLFDLDYQGPVVITFDQTVHAPVDTVLNTYLDVNRSVTTPLTAAFSMLLDTPKAPLPIVVDDARLKLPLHTLRLERAPRESPQATPRTGGQDG